MVNSHLSVGIAQVVFYAPVLPLAVIVLVKNWTPGPRMAWYPLVTFCLLRLAGGIISIIRQSSPDDIGLIIADSVLLNIGLIPLLVALIGIIRIILITGVDRNSRAHIFTRIVHPIFLVAVILLVVAGPLVSKHSTVDTARSLTKAAYVILAVILGMATSVLVYLFTQRRRIAATGFYYIPFSLAAVPFVAVRTVYGLLYAFTDSNLYSVWDPIFGSAVAFALMCLLAEYVALCIFLWLGFHRMRESAQPPRVHPEGPANGFGATPGQWPRKNETGDVV